MLSLLILACINSGDPSANSDSGATDTAEAGNSDGGGTAPACATVNAGDDWAWSGECPQMNTPVVVTVDGCAMTLDYDAVGGMTMGMPYSAAITSDSVIFADDNSVSGCVGTVETADKITGSCGDGCVYTLKR